KPLVSVTVTGAPVAAVVALTASVGEPPMVNGNAVDVPPPGAGEEIGTCAVPLTARSVAGIAACSCVLLTKVVGRSAPFQRTTDAATKPLPVAASVNAATPVGALLGLSTLKTGVALGPAGTVMGGLVAPRVDPSFRKS